MDRSEPRRMLGTESSYHIDDSRETEFSMKEPEFVQNWSVSEWQKAESECVEHVKPKEGEFIWIEYFYFRVYW